MIPLNSKPLNSYPLYSFPLYGGSTIYVGILKRWDGLIWTKSTLKTHNGISFENKPLKVYTSENEWGLVDTTGS